MASRILDAEEDRRGAVQVPDPFLKRVLRNATLAVLERAAEQDRSLCGGAAEKLERAVAGAIVSLGGEVDLRSPGLHHLGLDRLEHAAMIEQRRATGREGPVTGKNDAVGAADHLVLGEKGDSQLRGKIGGDEWIAADQVIGEGFEPPGDLAANRKNGIRLSKAGRSVDGPCR